MANTISWAIIGGGNGGQSLAGHLAMQKIPVRLYDISSETINAIHSLGGIYVDGAVEGFGLLECATTQIAEALDGVNIIVIVAPATAHRSIACDCAPHLKDGQIIFLHPGATGGALEFKQVLETEGCGASVIIAESNSLIYACRSPEPGRATILGIKKELTVASLPSSKTKKVMDILTSVFPQIKPGKNVLETSLSNPNAIMHPAPTLLNTSLIESDREWLYYWDGITPSIGNFIESLDRERLALSQAFGLDLPSIREWYKIAYGAEGNSLSEAVKANKAYAGVKGQTLLQTRYLLEDIPMGLVPMVSLGKLLGIEMIRMETVIRLAEFLLDIDFSKTGRNIECLGLAGKSAKEILNYVETGQ